jgi:hypothetical protein
MHGKIHGFIGVWGASLSMAAGNRLYLAGMPI